MIDLVTVAVFGFTICVVWLLARLVLRPQRSTVAQRLTPALKDHAVRGNGVSVRGDVVQSLAAQIPAVPLDNGELDRDLRRAGYYRPRSRLEFLALRNALVILAMIATGAIVVAIGPGREQVVLRVLIGGLIVAVLCWGLPRVVVALQGRARVNRIRRSLPDALDMVSMCLHGGLPLEESLEHVGREMFSTHPDLAAELLIVRQQAQMNTLPFAFEQFAARIDAPEVLTLAALIVQNQRLGTNVAASIMDYSDRMRMASRQNAEMRAGSAQWKVLFPVVLCLLPAVLLILWGPALIELSAFVRQLGENTVTMP